MRGCWFSTGISRSTAAGPISRRSLVRPGDVISVREGSRGRKYFKEMRAYMEERPAAPEWLSVDLVAMQGTVLRVPERRDIDLPLNEQLIVEYYSR